MITCIMSSALVTLPCMVMMMGMFCDAAPTSLEIIKIKQALHNVDDDEQYKMADAFVKQYKDDQATLAMVISTIDECIVALKTWLGNILISCGLASAGFYALGWHKKAVGVILLCASVAMLNSVNIFALLSNAILQSKRLAMLRDLCNCYMAKQDQPAEIL